MRSVNEKAIQKWKVLSIQTIYNFPNFSFEKLFVKRIKLRGIFQMRVTNCVVLWLIKATDRCIDLSLPFTLFPLFDNDVIFLVSFKLTILHYICDNLCKKKNIFPYI